MSGLQIVALVVGAAGGLAFLAAGYLVGARNGREARDELRADAARRRDEAAEARARLAEALERREDPLRADLRRVLDPLLERERLVHELSHLDGPNGARRDLTALLDQIATRGNFTAVALHDDDGWPLAASAGTGDLDRLSATASLLLLLAERVARDTDAAPLSVLVHDAANQLTLSRLFDVNGQRLSLTAVASGVPVTPTTLDPALSSIVHALSGPAPGEVDPREEPDPDEPAVDRLRTWPPAT